MKDSRYFYGGPVWTVNSQEMFMGLVFWILIFLIPVYPMLDLGLFIGGVIGVKLSFVIFPLIFIALGYLILIFLGYIVRRQREVKQKQIDEVNIKKYKARVRTPIRMAENNKEELS